MKESNEGNSVKWYRAACLLMSFDTQYSNGAKRNLIKSHIGVQKRKNLFLVFSLI